MYQINDMIIYGTNGTCKIEDITDKNFGGIHKEYYILKPVSNVSSTIYVPVNNTALVEKMRRTLSTEEIYQIIESMPEEEVIWIDDENQRKERYKEILSHGDRINLVKMIETLYQQKLSLSDRGKKLHVSDERFFKEAEKLLYEEFAVVLNIKQSEVLPFILNQIKLKEKV